MRRNKINELSRAGILKYMLIAIPNNINKIILILTKQVRLRKVVTSRTAMLKNKSFRRRDGVFLVFSESQSAKRRKRKTRKINLNKWMNYLSH